MLPLDQYTQCYQDVDTLAYQLRVSLFKLRELEKLHLPIPPAMYEEFKRARAGIREVLDGTERYLDNAFCAQGG